MKSGPNLPIRLFFVFLCPKILRIFFNICGQHRFNFLTYSVARPGAGEAYWLTYIILHFVLGFIDLC